MPDFGLTEALDAALKASRKVSLVPPEEAKLAAGAAETTPAAAAPKVPGAAPSATTRQVARVPSVQAPPATPAPGSIQAAPIDPSLPPPDLPPEQASQAAAAPTAALTPPDAAPTGADGAPPVPVVPEAPVAPVATPTDPSVVAPANRVTPPPEPPAQPPPSSMPAVQERAQRFVTANLNDYAGKLDMTHMPNVDTMASPDGVKAAILQVADDNKDAIEAARGGTVSDQQLIGLAQDLSLNSDVVKQRLSQELGAAAERPQTVLAARMVEQQSVGMLLDLSDRVAHGTATSEEIARFEQQMQAFEMYRTELSGVAAGAGRTTRAFGIPVGLPTDVLDHISTVLKQNNPDMQATAKAIRLAGTPSGVANIVHGSIWYRSLVKAPMNLLQRIFINGILSGPPTWAKIMLGNNLNLALNTFDLFAAGIGRGMAGLAARIGGWPTAEEGVTLSDAYAHFHGLISGGADALRVAGRVLKTGQSLDGIMRSEEDFGANTLTGGKHPILPELRDSYFGGVARMLGTIIDFPGRIVGAVDAFTRTIGERAYATMMSMKEIRERLQAGTLRPGDAEAAMLDMMQNQSEEMSQAAAAWGARQTFQTPFPEDGAGEAFQNVLNKAPPLRFIFPFMRTATNIFKQSLGERTPLAAFSARILNQLKAGGFEGDLAKARISTGIAIGSMLGWMAIHEMITGDAPKDPKQRAEWELSGRAPYSVRITDPITGKVSWRSYTWFEPIATLAGVVADTAQLWSYVHSGPDTLLDSDQRFQDVISHVMASVIQNTGNKTFMQGAAQFAEMYNDPQRAFGMWFDQVGASMVPFSGLTKFARNEQDPYLRQAFSLLDKIRDDLPTITGVVKGSKSLPARLDVFGQPRKTTYGNSILGPLNPLPGSPDVHDDVTDEIQRVMEQTRTVPITMPSKQLALMGNGAGLQDGQGMRLTPREYNEYVRMSRSDPVFDGGKTTFRDKLAQTIASPLYQRATPAQRHDLLQMVQHQADRIGRVRLFKEDPEFAERMTQWTADKNRLKFNQ